MKRRIISAIFALTIAVSALPTFAAAEVNAEAGTENRYSDSAGVSLENAGAVSAYAEQADFSQIGANASGALEEQATYPEIKSVVAVDNGFKVTWNRYDGAVKYRLFVKSNGSGWKKVGDTSALTLEHTGVKDNTEYTYTVRALDKNGAYASGYLAQGWSATHLATPSITSVQSVNGGLKVTWNKVTGAQNYRVSVKSGSSWKSLGNTSATTFTDSAVTAGKTYTYTIRCISPGGAVFTSYFDSKGKSGTYVEAPAVTRIENVSNGAKLTWSKVAGASKYRVFVKTNGSDWSRAGDTETTGLIHTGAKNNTVYTYAVRALDKNGAYASDYYRQGWSNRYLVSPALSAAESVFGGVKITWKKVDGAEKYRVFVKNGSSWKNLGDTAASTFTDQSVTSGKTYTYTVRCVSADGKAYTSCYDSKGISVKYVAAPEITAFQNTGNGTKLTWGASAGAASYRVYVKDGTQWSKIGETAGTSFTHEKLVSGRTYTYTVRCLDSSRNFASGYYTGGWSNRYLAPPSITSISSVSGVMKLAWTSVSTVSGYRVYRKSFGGTWSVLADVKENSYTDAAPPENIPYTYTLRYLDTNGKLISDYIADTKYYYNGALANGRIAVKGSSYSFRDGRLLRGYVTIDGSTYYYSSDGVLQKDGVVGNKTDGYYYADKNGKIDFSFTGIAKNSNGYWYCRKGKVDFTYRNGVTYGGSDWNVLDGKATKVTTEADRTLFRALKLVAKITDSSMTKPQKLKKSWDYVKDAYIELNPRIPHYHGMDWPVVYANDMFVNGAGNCFSYAAAFAYMAKAIGYENVYCCHSGGHGWAEIDGLVYDPEWSRHFHVYNYYGLSYDTKTDPDYKGAISAGYPWMHVKI